MPGSSLGVFLRRLPVTLVAGVILWLLLRPVADVAVAGLTQTLIRAFEHPRVTRLVVDDHRVQVRRSDFRSGSGIPTFSLAENNFFNHVWTRPTWNPLYSELVKDSKQPFYAELYRRLVPLDRELADEVFLSCSF
jgi:hypothetical protein